MECYFGSGRFALGDYDFFHGLMHIFLGSLDLYTSIWTSVHIINVVTGLLHGGLLVIVLIEDAFAELSERFSG